MDGIPAGGRVRRLFFGDDSSLFGRGDAVMIRKSGAIEGWLDLLEWNRETSSRF